MFDPVIHPLLRRLGMEPPLWHDEDFQALFGTSGAIPTLSDFVLETTPSAYRECPYCGPGTSVPVEIFFNRRTGTIGHYVPCRDCGLTPIDPASLRRWLIEPSRFAERLTTWLNLSGPVRSFANGRCWSLGRGRWAKRSHEAFLLRAFDDRQADEVRERLRTHPKAVIFAATVEDGDFWRTFGPQTVIVLDDCLVFDGEIRGSPEAIESVLAPESSRKSKSPKSARRGSRLDAIAKLEAELTEHLREARSHAFSRRDLVGTPELLPRPTMTELGRRVGFERYEVSRCFNDPDALRLRYLWELADDLERLMKERE